MRLAGIAASPIQMYGRYRVAPSVRGVFIICVVSLVRPLRRLFPIVHHVVISSRHAVTGW